ncbi:MAG: proline--tRNA ligase, partial [Pseudomonadota bacterium]|nr:proline--tRNA ligase [Pseudomonadota bacterium]
MRVSEFFLSTLKEAPAEAELPSHKLMLRAGLIRRLSSGLYSWMPLGLRVLRKVEAIVRDEMNRAGAIELLMPAIQPAELWQETRRWQKYGPELLRLKDRHDREYCFGPTHEEVITDIVRRELRSYRQLPVNFYQIQGKFRDETRPRFGVMRSREFIMKDAYSFHPDTASLEATYKRMHEAYTRIFTRLSLQFRSVAADTGSIGGTGSHEFHVLAECGEDAIAYCPQSDFAANIELAEAIAVPPPVQTPPEPLEKIATPQTRSIDEVSRFFNVASHQIVKTLIVENGQGDFIALLLRGDHELNEVKAAKLPQLGDDFRLANEDSIRTLTGSPPGSIGPIGLTIPIIADRSIALMENFITGANEEGFHYRHASFSRDLTKITLADIRNVKEGDPSPDQKGLLSLCRGIEVGHIFQLGTRYSETMNATFLDETGQSKPLVMGCYGIGISRIVGAAVEQCHDEKGISWPLSMAPFTVTICPIGFRKNETVRVAAEQLYLDLSALGIEVLLDDRDERPGVMFADMELIGIPLRLTLGERHLGHGQVE